MAGLSTEQVNGFLENGYLKLSDCFSRDAAVALTDLVFTRLGYDPNDPATWREKWKAMKPQNHWEVRDFAPKAWDAICEIMGGEERIAPPCTWNDAFIANFGVGADTPWQPPSAEVSGWHKDGNFFRHFLDSPEQGLLTVVIWTDIEPRGGGTFIAPDSVPIAARYLAEHPEGVLPNSFPWKDLIKQCHRFSECTGRVGDIFLLHPFMLHAVSQNHSGRMRLITNPPVHLNDPMNFDRPDGNYSLVEKAILNALGVERYEFVPTAPRASVIPGQG